MRAVYAQKRLRVFALKTLGRRAIHQYERKTPLEHVLLRPGMYIGNTEWVVSSQWVYDQDQARMVKKDLLLNPGLLKIFDEILVNAADSVQSDKTTTHIEVSVVTNGSDSLQICVKNNGDGIPVVPHPTEQLYIPELIFGHLLTGSNFNDQTTRFTGGSHGYGAKLANIFSKSFEVDIADPKNGLRYQQRWSENMTRCEPADISALPPTEKKGYVRICFEPDLERFRLPTAASTGVDCGEDPSDPSCALFDLQAMIQRRCLDVASCLNLPVHFNCAPVPSSTFQDYIRLFLPDAESAEEQTKPLVCRPSGKWVVGLSESPAMEHEALSFVNNVWTPRGGAHVQLVVTQVTKALERAIAKKGLKPPSAAALRSYIMVVVSCQVANPHFEGQTKDSLLTKGSLFVDDCVLPKAFLVQAIERLLPRILADLQAQEQAHLAAALKPVSSNAKAQRRSLSVEVPKLEDAHEAGSPSWRDCTLILTEGDSAKALAIAGISALGPEGRDCYGVLPLRGKVLNARVATRRQVADNDDLLHLCKALGLNFGAKYTPETFATSGLRYGHVLLMCDQDADGSHIKGLILNFFHTFWPGLLDCAGFLQHFATPLVKVRDASKAAAKGDARYSQVFFNLRDYRDWLSAQATEGRDSSSLQVKYYKGLGTSTAEEGRDYFLRMDVHRGDFVMDEHGADNLDLAFSKHRAADRRDWLISSALHLNGTTEPGPAPAAGQSTSVSAFIHEELVHFSHYDNLRSLPHALDGMKPSQRKILFACFRRNLVDECKVAQLAGYIAEHTAYHHGEASLHATIINMAQDFVGSNNNLPLLEGAGQFGTRARGGHDHASARYIFVKLSPMARLLFPREDDALLSRCQEDGRDVEPVNYVPIVPMLLVNGAQGIGTGWSSVVPPHHPMDLARCIERKLDGLPCGDPLIAPWFRGFCGTVTASATTAGTFVTEGVVCRANRTSLEITDLPVGKWTEDYKLHLLNLVQDGRLRDFREDHGVDRVHFQLLGSAAMLDEMEREGLPQVLKLQNSVSHNNMHAYVQRDDGGLCVRKFASPMEIVDVHFDARWALYTKRKALLLKQGRWREEISRARSGFVQDLLAGRLLLHRDAQRGAQDVERELRRLGYLPIEHLRQEVLSMQPAENSAVAEGLGQGFDYLLQMPLQSLTDEHAALLRRRGDEARDELRVVRERGERDMWMRDLSALQKAYTTQQGDTSVGVAAAVKGDRRRSCK